MIIPGRFVAHSPAQSAEHRTGRYRKRCLHCKWTQQHFPAKETYHEQKKHRTNVKNYVMLCLFHLHFLKIILKQSTEHIWTPWVQWVFVRKRPSEKHLKSPLLNLSQLDSAKTMTPFQWTSASAKRLLLATLPDREHQSKEHTLIAANNDGNVARPHQSNLVFSIYFNCFQRQHCETTFAVYTKHYKTIQKASTTLNQFSEPR